MLRVTVNFTLFASLKRSSQQGAGFETDTNIVTMITQNEVFELELMSKEEVAFHLLDKILELRK